MFKNKNKIIYIASCILLMVANILYLSDKMPTFSKFRFNESKYIILLIISLIIEIGLCTLVYILNKKNWKIEKIFLFVIIPLGIIFMLLTPVGQTPDEHVHFARSYEVSDFKLISPDRGYKMPKELYGSLIAEKSNKNYSILLKNITKENSGKVKNYYFPTASVYNFICYTPQAVGISIGKIFNAPVLLDAYLGRLVNFLCFVLLMYLSMKFIPFCKEIIALIAFIPITLQEAISLAPDAFTIGMATFLVSYTLYLTYTKEKVTNKDFSLLCVLCLITSLCKIVYIPVCLILFIIPKEKFDKKILKILLLALVVVIINAIWLKIASVYLSRPTKEVDVSKQIKFILSNPLNYVVVFFRSILYNYKFYLFTMFGQMLETLSVNISKFYPALFIIFMIILTILERFKNVVIKKKNKIILFIICASITILIFTSLYVQWTHIGSDVIIGVQGRYFLPILFLVPMLFLRTKTPKKTFEFNKINMYVFMLGIFANVLAFIFILSVNS